MTFRPPDRCYTCYNCRNPLRKWEKSPTQLCREVRAAARRIELINWIWEEGRDGDDLGAILAGLSERLVARGVPLCRTTLLMPTLDPTAAVISYLWRRDKGLTGAEISREDAYGAAFQRSPVHYPLEHNIRAQRRHPQDPAVP